MAHTGRTAAPLSGFGAGTEPVDALSGLGAADFSRIAPELCHIAQDLGHVAAELDRVAPQLRHVAAELGRVAAESGRVAPELLHVAAHPRNVATAFGFDARLLRPFTPQLGRVAAELRHVAAHPRNVATAFGFDARLLRPFAPGLGLVAPLFGFVTGVFVSVAFVFVLVSDAGISAGAAKLLVERRRAIPGWRELAAVRRRWRGLARCGRRQRFGRGLARWWPPPLT